MVDAIFLYSAIIGGTVLAFQLVLMALGMGDGGDADVAGADGADGADFSGGADVPHGDLSGDLSGDVDHAHSHPTWTEAGDADWDTEFLSMTLAVAVVDGVEQAIEHIARHGSGHSEAIVTGSYDAARGFELGVDAACVYVNASTRFTDGGEFGFGAEIGNATQKLHARGPIGLRELCTFKYVVRGDGQVRG